MSLLVYGIVEADGIAVAGTGLEDRPYLVERARVGEFVALVEQLDDCLDGVDLVCTGPCPPYSFADGAAHLGPVGAAHRGSVIRSTS